MKYMVILWIFQVCVCNADETTEQIVKVTVGNTLNQTCLLNKSTVVQGLLIRHGQTNTDMRILAQFDNNGKCSISANVVKRYEFTCDDITLRYRLLNVTLEDNGLIFECHLGNTVNITKLQVQAPPKYVRISPYSLLTIDEGKEMNMTCETSATRPEANILWFISTQSDIQITPGTMTKYTNASGLTITNSVLRYIGNSSHNGGRIYCTANNGNDRPTVTSEHLQLIVFYGPKAVIFDEDERSFILQEGQIAPNITCTADCNPDCVTWWSDNNLHDITSNILILGNVSLETAGNYNCSAGNRLGLNKRGLLVDILYGPVSRLSFDVGTKVLPVLKGQPTPPVTCLAECNPECDISWFYSGNETSDNSTLNLSSLNMSFPAEFECVALNHYGNETITLKVIEHYPPEQISLDHNNVFTILEDEVIPNITCCANCAPECDVSWKNVSEANGAVLKLGKAKLEVAGEYECVAINKYGVTNTNITVVINYIRSEVSTDNITCQYWQKVNLECKAHGQPENFTFLQWQQYVGHQFIRYIPGIDEGALNKLTLEYCSYQDAGRYFCQVENGLELNNSTVIGKSKAEIFIKAKPVISGHEVHRETKDLPMLKIIIRYYAYPEPTETIWLKDDEEISLSDKFQQNIKETKVNLTFHGVVIMINGYESELVIKLPSNTDNGEYALRITNDIGSAIEKVDIDKFSLSKIEYAAIAAGIVLILTLPVICGLYFRRKRTQRRRSMIIEDKKRRSQPNVYQSHEHHGTFENPEPNDYDAVNDNENVYAEVNDNENTGLKLQPSASVYSLAQDLRSLHDELIEDVDYLEPAAFEMVSFRVPGTQTMKQKK